MRNVARKFMNKVRAAFAPVVTPTPAVQACAEIHVVDGDWSQFHQLRKGEAMAEFDRLFANVDMIKVAARIEFDRLAGL